jgi:hypothetical protein
MGKIGDAALKSAVDPRVWLPASAALVFQIDHMDERLSDWASSHTPLFGSNDDADDASDYLRDAAAAGYVATVFLTPSGEDEKTWAISKLKGLGVGLAAISLTVGTTDFMKSEIDRTRPDHSDRRSFPSGHASFTAACATLGIRNAQYVAAPPWGRTAIHTGFELVSLLTGWSRVEAGVHYPSDVLFGMALGNFLAGFVNDAFMGIDKERNFQLGFEPRRGGALLSVAWRF